MKSHKARQELSALSRHPPAALFGTSIKIKKGLLMASEAVTPLGQIAKP